MVVAYSHLVPPIPVVTPQAGRDGNSLQVEGHSARKSKDIRNRMWVRCDPKRPSNKTSRDVPVLDHTRNAVDTHLIRARELEVGRVATLAVENLLPKRFTGTDADSLGAQQYTDPAYVNFCLSRTSPML